MSLPPELGIKPEVSQEDMPQAGDITTRLGYFVMGVSEIQEKPAPSQSINAPNLPPKVIELRPGQPEILPAPLPNNLNPPQLPHPVILFPGPKSVNGYRKTEDLLFSPANATRIAQLRYLRNKPKS